MDNTRRSFLAIKDRRLCGVGRRRGSADRGALVPGARSPGGAEFPRGGLPEGIGERESRGAQPAALLSFPIDIFMRLPRYE